VTLFNDMCLLAPGTLLDKHIVWEPVDARTVCAKFTNGSQTVAATLHFSDDGLLTNFVSDDRSRSSPDGKIFTRLRFSTPVRDYRDFGGVRLAAHGDARWSLPEGDFTYGEFELVSVSYNVSAETRRRFSSRIRSNFRLLLAGREDHHAQIDVDGRRPRVRRDDADAVRSGRKD
jgi:hypothetical protein